MNEALRHYQTRPLSDDFPFLSLDGITQKVREIGVEKKVMLCALGMREELTSFLDCPKAHRKKVRTTNVIERAFREVRRRVRPMNCFTNPDSVDRIILWSDKPPDPMLEGKATP